MKKWLVFGLISAITISIIYFGPRLIPPRKTKDISAVILELEAWGKKNGDFKIDASELPTVQALEKKFTVYYGNKTSEKSIEWRPHDVSAHDFSILTYGTGYSIFLPTSKIKTHSISSFWVWQYSYESGKWQRGKIYWTLMGSFWAEK